MPNENAITSTVAVHGNIIEKVDRYVFLRKTFTQVGDLLPEIKRRIAICTGMGSNQQGGQSHEEQEGYYENKEVGRPTQ